MTLHDRINTLEGEARGRIQKALATGNEKLLELDGRLARIAKDDWTLPAMRRQLGELRTRAESFRASAIKRVGELPGEAVSKLASSTRAPIQNLARSLGEFAKKIEPAKPESGNGQKPA